MDYVRNILTFRQVLRMFCERFHRVLEVISKYAGISNNPRHPQKYVELQLAVALYRFGHFGNGTSQELVAQMFVVSEGAVDDYVNWVIEALMNLMDSTIKWPNAEEKEKSRVKNRIFSEYGFSNCIGYVDLTRAVLETCPPKNGENYFSRKKTMVSLWWLSAMIEERFYTPCSDILV